MHLSYLGPASYVFISWVSSGLTTGSGCSLMAARWQVFFSFLSSLRAHRSPSAVAAIAEDWDILCLLIQQAIFHFSPSSIDASCCFPTSLPTWSIGLFKFCQSDVKIVFCCFDLQFPGHRRNASWNTERFNSERIRSQLCVEIADCRKSLQEVLYWIHPIYWPPLA